MIELKNIVRQYWYVFLLFSVLAVICSIKEALTENASGDPYIFWAAGQKFLQGMPLYEPINGAQEYLYPPIAAVIFQLLALMPFPVAVGVFTFVNFLAWLALLGLTYLILRIYFPDARLKTAMLIGGLATIRYFWHNIIWVNVNVLVALFSVSGLYIYLKGRQTTGIGLLTLAMWFKVMPLLLINIFIIRKPGPTLIRVGGFSLLMALILLVFRGANQGIQDYLDFWHVAFKPFLLEGKVYIDWIAFGVSATLSKLLIAHPDVNGIHYNIVNWSPAVVGKISLVVRLALVGLTYYQVWRSCHRSQVPLLNILLAYLTILLVAGVSWEGHHVVLLPVIAGLYQTLTVLKMNRLRRLMTISSIGVGLMTSDLLGGHLSDYVQAFSLITYNVLLLYSITLWAGWESTSVPMGRNSSQLTRPDKYPHGII